MFAIGKNWSYHSLPGQKETVFYVGFIDLFFILGDIFIGYLIRNLGRQIGHL